EGGNVPKRQGEPDRDDGGEKAKIDITPAQVARLYQQAALDAARNRHCHGTQPRAVPAMQAGQRHRDLLKESARVAASVMVVDRSRSEPSADLRRGDP